MQRWLRERLWFTRRGWTFVEARTVPMAHTFVGGLNFTCDVYVGAHWRKR
jgi:hypothetical protein